MYNIRPTTKFQKDLKRVKKRGFDISLLTDIIKKLAAFLMISFMSPITRPGPMP